MEDVEKSNDRNNNSDSEIWQANPVFMSKKSGLSTAQKKARRRHFSGLCRFYVRNAGQTIDGSETKTCDFCVVWYRY